MSLKVTLTRKIDTRRFTFLAQLSVWEERKDIQNILHKLQNKTENLANLPTRLQKYLERERLINKGMLTEKAERVLETGSFPIPEQGVYNIWYVQQDSLMGTCPIMMQRIQATGQSSNISGKLQPLPNELELGQTRSVVEVMEKALENESSVTNIERLTIQDQQGIPAEKSLITLTWHWDDIFQKQSHTQLEGIVEVQLYNNRKDKNREKNNSVHSVKLDLSQPSDYELMPELIALLQKKAQLAWQQTHQRAAITLEQLNQYQEHSPQIKTEFIVDQLTVRHFDSEQYGRFEWAKIEQLPVMPASPTEAESWTQQLLVEDWKKGYQPETDLLDSQRRWYEHAAIRPYALQPGDADEWISQLSPQQHAEAFWHIAAPFDLNPN